MATTRRTGPFSSEALRRNEPPRQRGQLPRDVQKLRFRPARTNELDPDGKPVLGSAERHDQSGMAARIERRNVGVAVVVVGPHGAIEIERAALLAALERRTIRDGSEEHVVAAEELFDVLDQRTLDTEGRCVVLRIHLERATQKPHHMRLPPEQTARNEHWENLAHHPGHVLSDGSTEQLHEHFAGARVDRRRRLFYPSARTLDPSSKCSELLARLSACDILLEPVGPRKAQFPSRPARRWTPVDRCDFEIGGIRAAYDLPQEFEIINGTAERPWLPHTHKEAARLLWQGHPPVSHDGLIGRLEAEDAAEVRRDPQRSSPISAQLQRRETSSDRRRTATRAATRRALESVRILALWINVAFHLIALEVGWYVRLAKNNRAGGLYSSDEHSVLGRDEILHALRIEGRRRIRDQELLFDCHGDAVKRPPALAARKRFVRFPCARARVCFEQLNDGVELAVVGGDAR